MSSIFDYAMQSRDEPMDVGSDNVEDQGSAIFQQAQKSPPLPPQESTLSKFVRQPVRTGARAIETALGAPRAGAEFLESLVPEQLIKSGAEKIGIGEPVGKALETAKKFAPYKLLPSSKEIREGITEPLLGSYSKPKNKAEQISDNAVSDFVSLALPFPGEKIKKGIQLIKPLAVSLGSNLAAETAEWFGAGDEVKNGTKLGTMVLGSMINPKGADKFVGDLYDKARQARPERVRVNTPNLSKGINQIRRKINEGGSETWKNKINTKLSEIENEIAGDSIEVGQLEKFKTSINKIAGELYAEKNVNKGGIKSAQRYVNKLNKIVDKSLSDYGKVNPKWESFYRPANEAFGAIQQSKKVRNFLLRNYKTATAPTALALFGVETALGPATTATVAGTGAVGVAAGELIARVAKSPTLRRYYENVITESLKGNANAVAENMRKLEEGLNREE